MAKPTPLHVVVPAPAKKRKAKEIRVGLMNPEFVYVPAANTNIAITFAKARAELARKAKS